MLVNDPGETANAATIAREAFGDNAVMYPGPSYLGSEDFAFMLQKKRERTACSATAIRRWCIIRSTSSTMRFCPWAPRIGLR